MKMALRSGSVLIALLSVLMMPEMASAIGQTDTLRNERGEVIIVQPYGEAGKDYVDGQFIARLKNGYLSLPDKASEAPIEQCVVEGELFQRLQHNNVYYVKRVFVGCEPYDTLRIVNGIPIRVPDLSQTYLFLQSGSNIVLNAVYELEEFSGVLYAEPNLQNYQLYRTPIDNSWSSQWNLKDGQNGIGCQTAWDGVVGSSSVKVAIIDAGISYAYEEMGGPAYPNGKVIGGYDYYYNDNDPTEDGWQNPHGTPVASIAAALTNNSNQFGIAGIAGGWHQNGSDNGVSLIAIKITNAVRQLAPVAALARAIKESADPEYFGCQILNCSWGGPAYSEVLREAVNFAYKLGASFVAAKGNGGYDWANYPCDYDYGWVTCVGGYYTNGLYCQTGNCGYATDYGKGIDLIAPGYNIKGIGVYNATGTFSGNSFATPHVTGSIALIRSIMPELRNEDTDWMLKFSAYDFFTDNNVWTWNNIYGHGDLRISTVINRIGNPRILPFDFLTYEARGGYDVSSVYHESYEFIGSPLNRSLPATVYDVRVDVTYPDGFGNKPFVWAVGEGTQGWSGTNPNYQDGWGLVVPGTATKSGCQMQTFVYEVWDGSGPPNWYPCAPEDVIIKYRLWGIKSTIQPNRGDNYKLAYDLPDDISLYCNAYPNPFNSSSQIEIKLPYESSVSIKIYDILGKEVNELTDGNLNIGRHQVVWNGKNKSGVACPSGIYFCVVNTSQESAVTRLVLLK